MHPQVLTVFESFSFFGERALLKQEPRFCSVRALTPLKTLMISQATFERAMGGRPLRELLPDYY